jgi:CubicO group peptidase (beta-lactamase class C family)
MFNFSAVDQILSQAVQGVCPAAQIEVRWHGQVVHSRAYGFIDPETCQHPTRTDSLFDLASVTKLFTTTTFMMLVEDGLVALDQPVCTILPEFSGPRPILPYEDPLDWSKTVSASDMHGEIDASSITFRNLLTHNSGLPAWRPFKDRPDAASACRMAMETYFSYPTGEKIVYSDVGLILLGISIERLTGCRLDDAISAHVLDLLELKLTRFLRVGQKDLDNENIAPTEYCSWRKRRMWGEVHDENAWRMNGVAGHAGLFSCAAELARFGQIYLDGGAPILHAATVSEMTRLQAEYNGTRRGIGFALWSADPEASSNPFSPSTFGHTGFTGTCLWMDPERDLVVALLTNEVYGGRQERKIASLRVDVHRAVVDIIDQGAAA